MPPARSDGGSTSRGSGGCSPASCRRRSCSPPSSCCRRCPVGRPRRRSGRHARVPRTPSPGSRAGRSGPAASGCGTAACVPLSPWSWCPTDARARGSSRTGRPHPDRRSAAHRPATATTGAAGVATPWRSGAPRHSRPCSPARQGPHGSAAGSGDPCDPSSRWPPTGARARPPTAQASASAGSCARSCARSHRPAPPCVSCSWKPSNPGRAS